MNNSKDYNEEHFKRLRKLLEEGSGRKMKQNADFIFLQQYIVEQTKEQISTTTLKRLWGYIKDGGSPRISSLDVLAHAAGYEDWNAFTTPQNEAQPSKEPPSEVQTSEDPPSEEQTSEEQKEAALVSDSKEEDMVAPAETPREDWYKHRTSIWLNLSILCILLFAAYVAYSTFMRPDSVSIVTSAPQTSGKYTLTLGEKFSSYDEYLRLFGVTATDTQWSQPVPHYEHIILWGPQYNHPEWHNAGNPDSLMPTITEYWEPADTKMTPELRKVLQHMNTISFNNTLRNNDIRITFMRDLVDSNFVFLGVYRVSLTKSDTTRIVWERVAEECDLDRLGYLELFRN